MTKSEFERRYVNEPLALRADGEKSKRIGGYAFKYNKLSRDLGGFVERIAPGAARKTLADGGDVLCQIHHDYRYLLGRTTSGTLRLTDDKVGLDYETDLPDISYARDLAVLAERGDIAHSSFWFRAIKDHWEVSDDGYVLRTLIEFELRDVAPVVTPAYPDTSVAVRSFAERFHLDSEERAMRALRSNEARDLVARVDDEDSGRQQPEPGAESQPGDTHWADANAARQAVLRDKSRTI